MSCSVYSPRTKGPTAIPRTTSLRGDFCSRGTRHLRLRRTSTHPQHPPPPSGRGVSVEAPTVVVSTKATSWTIESCSLLKQTVRRGEIVEDKGEVWVRGDAKGNRRPGRDRGCRGVAVRSVDGETETLHRT